MCRIVTRRDPKTSDVYLWLKVCRFVFVFFFLGLIYGLKLIGIMEQVRRILGKGFVLFHRRLGGYFFFNGTPSPNLLIHRRHRHVSRARARITRHMEIRLSEVIFPCIISTTIRSV